uniref:Uncharacterized protein n=1 Tax=Rhizophora mucronata TaxID=61149 RepID=A0A2P2QSN9_RHIMU
MDQNITQHITGKKKMFQESAAMIWFPAYRLWVITRIC